MKSDEELMSAAAAGDMDAFEELVLRHQDGAVRVAYRLLSDEDDARDVAQETFLRVLERAEHYRPTASFRTYLYRILTRICIDRYRKRMPEQHPDIGSVENGSDAPDEVVERRELTERVRGAIQALPLRQRIALVLQHYEGMSYRQIAEAMGGTERAVDSLLARARQSLKHRLRDLL